MVNGNDGMSRAERRRRERDAKRSRNPGMTMNLGECRFPGLFGGLGCCICGHGFAMDCPCSPVDALVHLERAHPDQDSTPMREVMDCPLSESEPAPTVSSGTAHQGTFQAPCGDMVAYITTAQFPTMAHYRWHAIYDHLEGGNCESVEDCGGAVMSGDV